MKKSKSFGSDGTLTDSGGSVDTAETDAGDAEMAPCAQAPAQPPLDVPAATPAPALSSPAHVPPCAKAPAEPPVQVAAATAAPTLTVPVPVNASPPVQVAPTPQLPAVAPPAVASSAPKVATPPVAPMLMQPAPSVAAQPPVVRLEFPAKSAPAAGPDAGVNTGAPERGEWLCNSKSHMK